jgi:hypothetical protein
MGKARASFDWNKSEESWLKRVQEQVAIAKPSVAILSYGMTAALELADIPAGEAHAAYLSKFITDTGRLMTGIREASGQPVRFVLFTPIQQQGERPDSIHSKALNEVAEALGTLGKTSGIPVVDILGATRRISMLRMVTYESPVILNDTGYRMLADRLPELLGIQAPAKGTDTALLGSTMITCRATIADLIDAMQADEQPDPRGRVDALLATTTDLNWLAMAAAWRYLDERPRLQVADVLRVQRREPPGAEKYDIASADGTEWDPGAGRGVYQLHSTGWQRL